MRNLRNIRFSEVPLLGGLPLAATAWDGTTDSLICAFGPAEDNAVIELKRKLPHEDVSPEALSGDMSLIASWDAPCPNPDMECDRILSLQYFPDTLVTCLVLEGGDIIVVREEPQPGEDKIEIVGSVDAGISAATWSPDEELLAISTKANTLLYMTRDFEGAADIALSQEDLKISQHVSVGWGKKETQFQGKRAKALRDPTMPEKVDEGKLSEFDDGETTLSWRGDGAYLALNSIEDGIRRVIRVYSREGALDSVSEPVDGLEGALSWRPSGNLIAGIQRLDNRIDVVFFERNGLRHGQFTLRLTEEERLSWASNIKLAWNVDSNVLAVQFKDRIQLWTTGNYHYYLKEEIPLSIDGTSLCTFRWHHEKSMRFTTSSPTSLLDTDWVFEVAAGSTIVPNDFGSIAVIDGRTLKLSPLKVATVPPPMALCELAHDSNVIDVAFSKTSAKIAILSAASFTIYSWDLKSTSPLEAKLCATHAISPSRRPRLIAFLGEDDIYVVTQDEFEGVHISSIFPDSGQEKLWIAQISQNNRTRTYSFIRRSRAEDSSVIPWQDGPATDTSWARAIQLPSGDDILFTLSRSGALYANKRLLAKSVTSFLLTSAHLIYTTAQHLLKFVHIAKVDDLEIPGDTPEEDERCRSVERGAKLITAMPSKLGLTLQMPRGNIETIYPRAFVLAGIRGYIENKKYKSAYLVCRSQMVDMNILYDYMPEQFLDNIPLFLDQVKRVEFIDEFLSRLKNEDVTKTLYKDTLKLSQPTEASRGDGPGSNQAPAGSFGVAKAENKVNKICDAFIAVLSNRIDTNLQNLVTSHVCKSPPDLDAGLSLVAKLREQNAEQAEEAVEHMCFLTDAHQLFNYALGLYDLELTLMVAQQAQRDPREYLPFLQKLHGVSELQRKYEIDNHLGRFTKALKTLHALGSYDDLKLYTIKHSLYKDALVLYKYQPELLRDMTQLYADYLYDQSNYKEAAIAYESLEMFKPAYESYKLAHMWRESLYCAALVPLLETDLNELATSLSSTLIDESKDYVSAARIQSDYLHDIPTAARLLCKGTQFGDACRLLVLHGHQDRVSEIVDHGLAEAMGTMTELLADCRSQLQAQVPRIQELKAKRVADPLGFYGGDPTGAGAGDVDIPDNISLAPTDASTMAGRSLFTRYTGGSSTSRASSRMRKREERRRAKGKKGTVYEEEYLVNSVRRLIEKVNSSIEEVEALVQAMLRRGMRERAAVVEKNLDEVLGMCRDCLSDVFETPAETNLDAQDKENEPPAGAISSGERVYLESMEALKGKGREPPVVKAFTKLSLLGG
ncbi:elongator complex protein 1 [Nannizzia gypsea CBS 118893]|uniref:Elongator complex protein 1 n=1 Tax=Arthroderma gypseum (strain ATCC MYA-4604 / CBS 118893) TaxID=535722 RepID=E5R329_ARTGP|nr:elongator complex protein 1 [Nannizzia gypsea CBS 118893]EFQ98733.1 elongator complex protein 1 [Nannizzia gypsea CBS 118893]